MHLLIVVCAKYLFVVPVAIFLWVLGKASAPDRRVLLFRAAVALATGLALAKGGGALYDDPRPFVAGHFTPMIAHAPDNGFPSDHSLLVFSCVFLVWPFDRRLAVAAAFFAAAVGVGRVASGLHHGVDVAASILFALLGAGVGALAMKRIHQPTVLSEQAT